MKKLILTGLLGLLLGTAGTSIIEGSRRSSLYEELREERETSKIQRQINGAHMDLLWNIQKQLPIEYWQHIQGTYEYHQLDSILLGDWEDFYPTDSYNQTPIFQKDKTYILKMQEIQ